LDVFGDVLAAAATVAALGALVVAGRAGRQSAARDVELSIKLSTIAGQLDRQGDDDAG
jgi:hypothetical protein